MEKHNEAQPAGDKANETEPIGLQVIAEESSSSSSGEAGVTRITRRVTLILLLQGRIRAVVRTTRLTRITFPLSQWYVTYFVYPNLIVSADFNR